MRLQIKPLRDIVVVELCAEARSASSVLRIIREPSLVRTATVAACGPEVRDLAPGMTVLINTAAATQLDGYLLVAEPTILGTL